jgi:hypothetical protein
MTDTITERKFLAVREVPEEVRRLTGRIISLNCVYSWITGLTDGRRLRNVRIGGRRFVEPEALCEFLFGSDAASDVDQGNQ